MEIIVISFLEAFLTTKELGDLMITRSFPPALLPLNVSVRCLHLDRLTLFFTLPQDRYNSGILQK